MKSAGVHTFFKFFLTLGLLILNAWIWVVIAPNVESNGNDITNIYEKIILVFILGPIVETYFIQILIVDESIKSLKLNKHLAVFISAVVFGLLHYKNWAYFLKTFIDSFFFGYLYLSFNPNQLKSFWFTALVHSVYNIIAYLS
jgi:hypothetical protein